MAGVDLVLGAHVLSSVPLGEVALVPGPFLAGADFFELTIVGRGGQGGMPHLSVDPVYAAAQVVVGLQAIVARETKPGTPVVISINAVQGGNAPNVVGAGFTGAAPHHHGAFDIDERAIGVMTQLLAGTALRILS